MIKSNKGFSLIEILLVVGFIASAVAAVFVVYPKVKIANDVQTEVSSLAQIVGGIQSVYSTSPNYNGLTTQIAIQAQIIPKGQVTGTSTFNNSFGNPVTISTVAYGAIANGAFTLTSDVPKEGCQKFINTVGATARIVSVNAVVIKDESASPVDQLEAAEAVVTCDGITGDQGTVILTYR